MSDSTTYVDKETGDFVYKHIRISPKFQADILKRWNDKPDKPPSIAELLEIVWPDKKDITARDFEGRAIKAFLATRQLKHRAATEYVPVEAQPLTDEQKEFINNNVSKFIGSRNAAAEVAQILYNNPSLNNLSAEARLVDSYMATIPSIVKYKSEVPKEEYTPPNTQDRAIARVNKYVLNGIDRNKITPQIKKNIDALIRYLHTASFIRQMEDYTNQSDRDLLECYYIRYAWTKPDLTEEESDEVLALANEKVISANIQKTISNLQKEIDDGIAQTGKTNMSLIETISTVRNEFNSSSVRQQKLLSSLKQKRSERIQEKGEKGACLTELFELWRDEESRKKIIKMNELNRQALEKDIDNLMSMDEIVCRVNGISREEILDG